MEEYCAESPERLIGLGIMPMSNARDATSEMERCARMGYKRVLLSAFPNNKGYPTPEDDIFWAAAQDLAMPVTIHIQMNRLGERSGPLLKYPNESEEAWNLRPG